jgi:hypothetical protein
MLSTSVVVAVKFWFVVVEMNHALATVITVTRAMSQRRDQMSWKRNAGVTVSTL